MSYTADDVVSNINFLTDEVMERSQQLRKIGEERAATELEQAASKVAVKFAEILGFI